MNWFVVAVGSLLLNLFFVSQIVYLGFQQNHLFTAVHPLPLLVMVLGSLFAFGFVGYWVYQIVVNKKRMDFVAVSD